MLLPLSFEIVATNRSLDDKGAVSGSGAVGGKTKKVNYSELGDESELYRAWGFSTPGSEL